MAYCDNAGQPILIHMPEGEVDIPTMTADFGNGFAIGREAKEQFASPRAKIETDLIRRIPYNGEVREPSEIQKFREIYKRLFLYLKDVAQRHLHAAVEACVIAVPSALNLLQRSFLKEAARAANLEIARILAGCETIALYQTHRMGEEVSRNVVIVDIGAGGISAAVARISYGVAETLSLSGDIHCGGIDLDREIALHLLDQFNRQHTIQIREGDSAFVRLLQAVEKAKRELSWQETAMIRLPRFVSDQNNFYDLTFPISRSNLRDFYDVFFRMGDVVSDAVQNSGLPVEAIDEVLISGGSSRLPELKEIVLGALKRRKIKDISSENAVAIGAAIQGGILAGSEKSALLIQAACHSIGIASKTFDVRLLERNIAVPTRVSKLVELPEGTASPAIIYELADEHMGRPAVIPLKRIIWGDFQDMAQHATVEASLDVDTGYALEVTLRDKSAGEEFALRLE